MRIRRWLWLLFSVVSPIAAAQEGLIIDAEELDDYARVLSLTADQRDLARVLLDGYEAEVLRIREDMADLNRGMIAEAQDVGGQRLMEIELRHTNMVLELASQFFAANDRFLDDMRLIIDDDQARHWSRVPRIRRRHCYLEEGRLPGAATDLNALLAGLDPPASGELESLEFDYERKLDALLLQRSVQFHARFEMFASGVMVRSSFDAITPDEQAALDELHADKLDTDYQLIELNERYIERFARVLSPQLADALRDAMQEATCGVYLRQDRVVETIYDRALAISSLDEQQRAAIEPLRDRFVNVVREADLAQALAMVESVMASHVATVDGTDAVESLEAAERWNEARLEYDRVVERCLARLRTELTATQIADAGWTELFDQNVYATWWSHVRTLDHP